MDEKNSQATGMSRREAMKIAAAGLLTATLPVTPLEAQAAKVDVTSCIGCHGAKGEGLGASNFPRLAGLPQYYMINQLKDYATGVRDNSVMGPIAKALTPAEMESVSAYFASLPVPPLKLVKKPAMALMKRGELLAKVGDMKIYVHACDNCHGPGGVGLAPAIPGLAAQYAGYLAQQVVAWKEGQRKNSQDQMLTIAQRLSEKDIQALGAYFESINVGSSKRKK